MEYSNELRALFRRHDLMHVGSLNSDKICHGPVYGFFDDATCIIGKFRENLELQSGERFILLKCLRTLRGTNATGTYLLNNKVKQMLDGNSSTEFLMARGSFRDYREGEL